MAATDNTATAPAKGVRARVRAELTAEIKAAATRQLATEGAAGLSLRAIAREMGMASSAIYRYFASKDELLTALIIDAYNDVGEAVEAAESAVDRADHSGRFIAIARAVRAWAHANPNEYALIYGSPVPGYAAPEDTIDPATRVPVCLITVLIDSRPVAGRSSKALKESLADLIQFTGGTVTAGALALGVEAWAEIFGLVSLELFGHFNNAVTDPEAFFDHAVSALAKRILGERGE